MIILVGYKKWNDRRIEAFVVPNHSQLNIVIMETPTNVANIPFWKNTSLENINNEIWKPIKDYEGLYCVSSFGRVKSLQRLKKHSVKGYSLINTRILKQAPSNGYLTVRLSKDGKYNTNKVHRLVALAFLNKKDNNINHKDFDKKNNFVGNLEWCSARENTTHYYKSQDTESKFTGVCRNKTKDKWLSYIHINGKRRHLGVFDSEEKASKRYQTELNKL